MPLTANPPHPAPADLPLATYRGERIVGVKLRKDATCWHCRESIAKGSTAYAVFGNGSNRMQRIHWQCVMRAAAGESVPRFPSVDL